MREIKVSTGVFARIWALRQEGEETESQILERVLRDLDRASPSTPRPDTKDNAIDPVRPSVNWRDDVTAALASLGGEANLPEIYVAVKQRRREGERSLPPSTEAIIRRELENNCSQSEAWTRKRDLFAAVNGIGGGRWALKRP